MSNKPLPGIESIEEKLKSLRAAPERDANRIEQARASYLARAEILERSLKGQVPVSSPVGTRLTWWSNILRRKENQKMTLIPTLLLVVTLLFGGTGATVAAAQSAMPDDLLYPVKLISEEISLSFSAGPEAKVKNQLKLLERRSDELDQDLAEDGDVSDEITDSLIDQLDDAIESTDGLGRENQMAALLRIQEHMQLVLQEKIDRGQPLNAQQNIQNLLDKVQARITGLEEYMNAPEELQGKFNMGQWKQAVENHNKNKQGDGTDTDVDPTMDPSLDPTLEALMEDYLHQNNGKGKGPKNK
jgi:hypothetical protein